MSNDVVSAGGRALSLDLSGVISVQTAEQQEAVLRAELIAKGLKEDRQRIIESFDPNKLNEGLRYAIRNGHSYFKLKISPPRHNYLYYNRTGPFSDQIWSELNRALIKTAFSHVKPTVRPREDYGYEHGTEYIRVYIKKDLQVSSGSNQGFLARVKDFVTKPFAPSQEKIEKYKSTFVADFQAAAQGVIDAAPAFQKAAQAKGLAFDVDVNQIATLSSRYIELAQQRQEEFFRVSTHEKMPLASIKDLGTALVNATKMHTLNEKDVGEIHDTTRQFVSTLERKISSIESSIKMKDSIALTVTNLQLAR